MKKIDYVITKIRKKKINKIWTVCRIFSKKLIFSIDKTLEVYINYKIFYY